MTIAFNRTDSRQRWRRIRPHQVEAFRTAAGGSSYNVRMPRPYNERRREERTARSYLPFRLAVLEVEDFAAGVEAGAGSRSEGPLMRTVMQ